MGGWPVEKILKESKRIWREESNLTPKFLKNKYLDLYNNIYYENSRLREVPELTKSNGSQRWQWVIRQIGLAAKKIKVKNKNSPFRLKPTSLRWVLYEKPSSV